MLFSFLFPCAVLKHGVMQLLSVNGALVRLRHTYHLTTLPIVLGLLRLSGACLFTYLTIRCVSMNVQ